jgi:hypothetical protein
MANMVHSISSICVYAPVIADLGSQVLAVIVVSSLAAVTAAAAFVLMLAHKPR